MPVSRTLGAGWKRSVHSLSDVGVTIYHSLHISATFLPTCCRRADVCGIYTVPTGRAQSRPVRAGMLCVLHSRPIVRAGRTRQRRQLCADARRPKGSVWSTRKDRRTNDGRAKARKPWTAVTAVTAATAATAVPATATAATVTVVKLHVLERHTAVRSRQQAHQSTGGDCGSKCLLCGVQLRSRLFRC